MGVGCSHSPRRDTLSVSEACARAARVSAVRCELQFTLHAARDEFDGSLLLRFDLGGEGDLFLDARLGTLHELVLNGTTLEPVCAGFRIHLPAKLLRAKNEIRLRWTSPHEHTGVGFHRFTDPEDGASYAYTDFEPFSAHRLFPCFDQPDIKAVYAVQCIAPNGWSVIGNGCTLESVDLADGTTRHRFAELPPFSTYLVALCAGPWHSVRSDHGGIPLGVHCRASLARHLDADEIFAVTKQGFDFYTSEFAQGYPFGKYDQIFVPEFNSGAMENVGAVTFNEGMVFRDPPTEAQRLSRAEVILHELAHMWFGNLVTMRWWEDLWLNESFATYISFLALGEATRFQGCWRAFLSGIKGWALGEDQKPSTHPISGRVEDTEQTFLNFDGITYGKGASVLKQLRAWLGAENFREGLRLHFRRHALGNASLADFLAALSDASKQDLSAWSQLWLETSGVNTLGISVDGQLVQSLGNGSATLRPHMLRVARWAPDAAGALQRTDVTEVRIDGACAALPPAFRPARGTLLWPNADDLAYARVALDAESVQTAAERLSAVGCGLTRMGLHVSLYDMLRDAQISPQRWMEITLRALALETDGEILEAGLRRAALVLSRYFSEARRAGAARHAFAAAETALFATAAGSDLRLHWSRSILGFVGTREDAARIKVWLDDAPDGINIDQGMRWRILVRAAAFALPGTAERIAQEKVRDPSDRGEKMAFACLVADGTTANKQAVFERFVRASESHDLLKSGMPAFFQAHQQATLVPLAQRWLEVLPQVCRDADFEYASRGFARLMAPHAVCDAALLAAGQQFLSTLDAGLPLRRLLVEELDEMQRTLRLRGL